MAKIPVFQISIEFEHPSEPRVKLILSEHLIEEFIQSYEPLRTEIINQKNVSAPNSILQQFGDYILFYLASPEAKIIYFFPLDLEEKQLTEIVNGDFLNDHYRKAAKQIKANLEKEKMRTLFTPLIKSNLN